MGLDFLFSETGIVPKMPQTNSLSRESFFILDSVSRQNITKEGVVEYVMGYLPYLIPLPGTKVPSPPPFPLLLHPPRAGLPPATRLSKDSWARIPLPGTKVPSPPPFPLLLHPPRAGLPPATSSSKDSWARIPLPGTKVPPC